VWIVNKAISEQAINKYWQARLIINLEKTATDWPG
jgi:hypothetical protein